MAESVSIGLTDPEGLKGPQWIQYGFFLHQLMYVAQATFFLNENRSIPADVYEAEMDRAAAILQMKSGKQWWEAGAKTQFARAFDHCGHIRSGPNLERACANACRILAHRGVSANLIR